MALDKLVDGAQLDSDLTSVANAIRTKGGTSAQLAFPADFVSAIAAIPSGGGGEYWTDNNYGIPYLESTTFPDNLKKIKSSNKAASPLAGSSHLVHAIIEFQGTIGSNSNAHVGICSECTSLKTLEFPVCDGFSPSGYNEDVIYGCSSIESVTVGSVGHPNTVGMGNQSGNYMLFKGITKAFNIIIYTSAASLADLPAVLVTGRPWGATNATVIYKSSVTGEVLT